MASGDDGRPVRSPACAPSPRPATSRRCARAARCPALVEADDDGLYVAEVPRRGAGAARRSSPRWSPASSPARSGCPCPSSSLVELDPAIGRAEPDPEIQDLLLASERREPRPRLPARLAAVLARRRAGADAGARGRRRLARRARDERRPHAAEPEPARAGTAALWLIDHGAALYLHHAADRPPSTRGGRSPRSRDHVLLPFAALDRRCRRAARAAGHARRCSRRSPARCPTAGSTATTRGVLRRLPLRAARGAARRSSRRRRCPWRGEPVLVRDLRVVPRVERGERINVGVIVFCRPLRFLGGAHALDDGAAARARARSSTSTRCGAHLARDRADRRRRPGRPGRSPRST